MSILNCGGDNSQHDSLLRPFSRSKTTYASMSDWRHMEGRINNKPVTLVNGDWERVATRSASETPYKPFVEPGRSDEYYKRYLQLAERVAHKYPNPGLPVERHGRAGASWRHIKEVQSHNNRVLYVDGIVRLYDKDYITSFASRNLPLGMARQTPRVREASHAQTGQIDLNWPSTQKARPINVTTSFLPGNPVKYKGFYNYK